MTNKHCPLIGCGNWGTDYCNSCRHWVYALDDRESYHQSHITPEQYHKRMDEEFPSDGWVWIRQGRSGWTAVEYRAVKGLKEKYPEYEIFCILPPLPPMGGQ